LIGDPLVQGLAAFVREYTSASRSRARAEALRREAFDLLAQAAKTGLAVASRAGTHDPIGEELAAASALLDEAHRFALRGQTSEVAPRLERAAEALMKAERFHLAPGEAAALPEAVRSRAAGFAPAMAALRQAVLNGPATREAVERAAADAAALLKSWRSGGNPGTVAVNPEPGTAPEWNPSIGCIPCARSHLAQVAAELEEAAKAPPDKRDAWVADAAKQLLALERYDWAEDRIRASAPEVQALIRRYAPEVASLRAKLVAGVGHSEIPEVAARARALQQRFARDAESTKTALDRAFELAKARAS